MIAGSQSKCVCGASYESFRAGHTFADVHSMLSAGHDPAFWQNRSRNAVLRLLAKLKRETWLQVHGYCDEQSKRERGRQAALKAWETIRARRAAKAAEVSTETIPF